MVNRGCIGMPSAALREFDCSGFSIILRVSDDHCHSRLVIFSVVKLPKERSLSSSYGNFEMMDIETDLSTDQMTDDDIDQMSLRPDQIPWTFEHVERPGKSNMRVLLLRRSLADYNSFCP